MIPTPIKELVVEAVRRAHANIRIAAFLRALSIVGMITGLLSFLIGINPLLAYAVLPDVILTGGTLLKMAVVGIIVYCISLTYYNATRSRRRDGMLRL